MAENQPSDVTPEPQLNQDDVVPLAQKLDALKLTGGPKDLLSAIIAVATHPPGSGEPRIKVDVRKEFYEQFAAAFTQGQIGHLDAKVELIGRTVAP